MSPDGGIYEGQFRWGHMDGEGKLIYPNGKIVIAVWKNGEFIGSNGKKAACQIM